MKGTIEPVDVEQLAAKIICATHCTTFDTTEGPGATDPAVRKQVVTFLTKEINTLFEKAA
jgi:nitrite reductase/ring-hydroxylating ferredoxin subunit